MPTPSPACRRPSAPRLGPPPWPGRPRPPAHLVTGPLLGGLAWLLAAGAAAQEPAGEMRPGGDGADEAPVAAAAPLLLRDAVLVDGTGAAPVGGVSIRIRDGEVVRIARERLEPEDGERVLDLGGRHVLPGLIDAHVHISTVEQAKRALRSGVTTARSAGVGHFADVGLRELAARGHVDIPEIVAAGYHVRPEPAEAFFLDAPELGSLRETGIVTPEALRAMVGTMTDRGVDAVKVNATARAGLPDTDPREPLYDRASLSVVVEAAGAAGLPVMAHAHGDEGGRAAVEAGVRSIEHGTYLSEATLRLMAERGTYLVPTIAVVEDLTRPGGDYDVPFLQVRGRHMLPRIRATARRAHELGVPLVAATDTGYGSESVVRLGHELVELVDTGLTPMEAIRSATSRAAGLLGVDERIGTVREGGDADLIVVDGDPLEDIRHLQDVLLVVNDGRVSVDRLTRRAR